MNVVTLKPDVYRNVARAAEKSNLTVDDWVNRMVVEVMSRISTDTLDSEEVHCKQAMYSWDDLGGMFASEKSDDELRDEYLQDKYGV